MLGRFQLRNSLVRAMVALLFACGATVALAAGGGASVPRSSTAHRTLANLLRLPAGASAAGAAGCMVTGVSLYVAPNPARAGDAVRFFGRVAAPARRTPESRTGARPCAAGVLL